MYTFAIYKKTMFFLRRNFVVGDICTLKQKKTKKAWKPEKYKS